MAFNVTSSMQRVLCLTLLASAAIGIVEAAPGDTIAVPPQGAEPAFSGDGKTIAFASGDSTLVTGDTNNAEDVFVKQLQTGAIQRVSVNGRGIQGNRDSDEPAISFDGRFVAFRSRASNLVAGDRNGKIDLFVHDRQTGITERVSFDPDGTETDTSFSFYPAISANGRFVAFSLNGQVLVRDRKAGKMEVVSIDDHGDPVEIPNQTKVSISADGRFVAFDALPNTAGDKLFVHDRLTGTTQSQSRDPNGALVVRTGGSLFISGNGRYVAFKSLDSTVVPHDTNGTYDVFVRDRQAGIFQAATVDQSGAPAGGAVLDSTLSGSGRFAAFASGASNIVRNDGNAVTDVFVRDMQAGVTERSSVSSIGEEGDDLSSIGLVSSDAKRVAFRSSASNLAPSSTPTNIFLHETDLGLAAVSVGPLALGFYDQAVNATSAAQTVSVTNTTGSAAAITGIALVGQNAGQFSRTHNCPALLAAGASCTVSTKFRPTSQGVKTANLNVNGGGGGLRSVSLSGKGVAP